MLGIKSMKLGEVDSKHLINFAPGIAYGGVIGATPTTVFSQFLVFKIGFYLDRIDRHSKHNITI